MSLWQLLWEFNDIFALSDDEVQSLVISHGHGPQKEEHEMEVLCGLQAAEQGDKEGLLPHSVSSGDTGPGVWVCLVFISRPT